MADFISGNSSLPISQYGNQYYLPGLQNIPGLLNTLGMSTPDRIKNGYLIPIGGGGTNNNTTNTPSNPFANASSGGVSGTLQPYVNRMTQNANQALYGGLLGYQPQQLIAGNAGGTPVSPTPPQYNLPSAIPQGLLGGASPFGNRAWMGGK